MRALAINQKVLGPDHPDVAMGVNNLGLIHYKQGHYVARERISRFRGVAFPVFVPSEGLPEPLADALYGGTKMRSAPTPNFVRRNIGHGVLNGCHRKMSHQRADAQHHPRHAVLATLSRHMFELADDRLQDFARTSNRSPPSPAGFPAQ